MIPLVDKFLDRITMYRLVLYYLIVLLVVACGLGALHLLAYSPFTILFSTIFLVLISLITNTVFSLVFEAPTNFESVYISALILALLITPTTAFHSLPFLGWAAVLSMASKYILAIGKKHIFNPVAIALVLVSLGLNQSASWWVGTSVMMPFVVVGGLLIVRKIRRFDLFVTYFVAALFSVGLFTLMKGSDVLTAYKTTLLNSSLFFLGFVMLTEPLTTPPDREGRMMYGALTGFLFSPQIHLGSIYSTPELSLVVGNLFSYLISPKYKLLLRISKKIQIAPDMFDFLFATQKRIKYKPGQYMEWTLSHPHMDSRGNRRYFTLASSPTEQELRIGVKFYPEGSSFKNALASLDPSQTIVASQMAGDFTLKKDPATKYVFLAGGIGITPFRSMLKYLVDTKQKRDIVLFYSNKNASEVVYRDVLDQAAGELGIKVIYTLTDTVSVPPGWNGNVGRVTDTLIKQYVPDYTSRLFYISGPRAMVTAFEKTLLGMGVPPTHIIIDYFPGFV